MRKLFLYGIWMFIVIILLIIASNYMHEHDATACYENINMVSIGDNVDTVLYKMKDRVTFFRFESHAYFRHDNTTDSIISIVFPFKDKDPASSYPSLCYSKRTNKVISVYIGQVY